MEQLQSRSKTKRPGDQENSSHSQWCKKTITQAALKDDDVQFFDKKAEDKPGPSTPSHSASFQPAKVASENPSDPPLSTTHSVFNSISSASSAREISTEIRLPRRTLDSRSTPSIRRNAETQQQAANTF